MSSVDTSMGFHSTDLPKHAKLIRQNQMIKHLVYQTYDDACNRQLKQFVELFSNMLTSTFSNPWTFLKGATVQPAGLTEVVDDNREARAVDDDDGEDPRQRVPREIHSRCGIEHLLNTWLMNIPEEAHQIDYAVDSVQKLLLKTYGMIRSQVCDQVELFAESFFKLPMMRRLDEDMSMIT